jgi:hypothetical protein
VNPEQALNAAPPPPAKWPLSRSTPTGYFGLLLALTRRMMNAIMLQQTPFFAGCG